MDEVHSIICNTGRYVPPKRTSYGQVTPLTQFYDGRKVTTYTTHQWHVVLEVFCVVYVGKPPTLHCVVGGLPTCCCWFANNNMLLLVYQHVVVGLPTTTCCCWFTNMLLLVYVVTFRPSYNSSAWQQRHHRCPSNGVGFCHCIHIYAIVSLTMG